MPRRGFKCHLCPKNYGSQEKLDAHMVIHQQRPFVCYHCNRNFANKRGISRHMRIHIISNPSDHLQLKLLIPCRFCQKCFPTREALHAHKATHVTPYECDICKKTFFYKWRWVYHMTEGCSNKPFTCAYCMRNFKSKDVISLHIRSKHMQRRRRYSCDLCPMSSTSKINYLYHMYKHTGQKGFVCPFCDKKFARNEGLQNHKKTHTNDTFECEFCLKKFTRRFALKTHRLLHLREDSFSCKICSKVFQYQYQLEGHMLSHNLTVATEVPGITVVKNEPGVSDTDTGEELKNTSQENPLEGKQAEVKKEKAKKGGSQVEKKPISCPKCSVICRSKYGLKRHMSKTGVCERMAIAFANARLRPNKKEKQEEEGIEEEPEVVDPNVPLKPKCYHFDYATKQYVPLYTNTKSPANIIAPPIFPSSITPTQTSIVSYNSNDDGVTGASSQPDQSRPNNRFLCLFCKKVFLTVSGLMEHASLAHKEETLKIKEEQLEANEERFFFKMEPMSEYEYEGNTSFSDSDDGDEPPPLLNVEVTMSDENNSDETFNPEQRLDFTDAAEHETAVTCEVDPLEGPPSESRPPQPPSEEETPHEKESSHTPIPLLKVKQEDDASDKKEVELSRQFRCTDIQKILIKREGSLLKAILSESKDKERFCSPDVGDADDLARVKQVDITCS